MYRVWVRRVVSLSAVLCVVSLVVAVTAVGRGRASCDARRGTTMLENGVARVFSFRGNVYACARPYGGVREVSDPGFPAPYGIQLDGGFVAWEHQDGGAGFYTVLLDVIDIKRESMRTAGSAFTTVKGHISSALPEFDLNAHGTVVYIETSEMTGGGFAEVIEDTAPRDTLLDRESWPSTRAPVPISTLGLSASGTVAYWMDQGTFRGAHIS